MEAAKFFRDYKEALHREGLLPVGPKIVHVAGTNGKGSTCYILSRLIEGLGFRTGLFTSPHLVEEQERLRIDDEMVRAEEMEKALAEARSILHRHGLFPQFFALFFTAAILISRWRHVDVLVLETGLGGRYDATNAVLLEHLLPSAITSISLDHTALLGETREAIALEKAGILKGQDLVLASSNVDLLPLFERVMEKTGGRLILTSPATALGEGEFLITTPKKGTRALKTSLYGDYQGENLTTALTLFELLEEELGRTLPEKREREILQTLLWRGRMQHLHTTWAEIILDGAHNPAGLIYAVEEYRRWKREDKILLCGFSKDKDLDAFETILEGELVAFVEFQSERSVTAQEFRQRFPDAMVFSSVEEAFNVFQRSNQRSIFVCGSLYLIGEILEKF